VSSYAHSSTVVEDAQLAENGDANAQCRLAEAYYFGKDIEKNVAQAIVWGEKSSNQGNSCGQEFMGQMYFKGDGVEQNPDKAISLLTAAAEQDNVEAQRVLGKAYFNYKKYPDAVEWFKKAAEKGDRDSQEYLGNIYSNGIGVEVDDEVAFEWFKKAAQNGSASAEYYLGLSYLMGKGVPKDYEKAADIFKKLTAVGNKEGQFWLAFMYYHGTGMPVDFKKAVDLLTLSANQGEKMAQRGLAHAYLNGNGVEKNLTLAKEWAQKSADQGDEQSKELLAQSNAEVEKVKAEKTREESCQKALAANEKYCRYIEKPAGGGGYDVEYTIHITPDCLCDTESGLAIPKYPENAKNSHMEGTVHYIVDNDTYEYKPDGKTNSGKLMKFEYGRRFDNVNPDLFKPAIEEAMRKWVKLPNPHSQFITFEFDLPGDQVIKQRNEAARREYEDRHQRMQDLQQRKNEYNQYLDSMGVGPLK